MRFYWFWMAWRSLSVRRGVGLNFMTWISIGGVALGVATLVIVLSIMGGFERNLVEKMINAEPHLKIYGEGLGTGFPAKDWPDSRIEKLFPTASHISPFIETRAVLRHSKTLQAVTLIGLDPKRPNDAWLPTLSLIEGEMGQIERSYTPIQPEASGRGPAEQGVAAQKPGIILGVDLASALSVDVGDEVRAINPQSVGSSLGALDTVTAIRSFTVVGIFYSGHSEHDGTFALVSMENARQFMIDYDESLDKFEYISGVGFNLKDPVALDEELRLWRANSQKMQDYQLVSWQDNNSALLFALKLEKFAMGSVLMLTVLVAAFSISGTIMMTVHHRRQHICLLKALGMKSQDVLRLFLSNGMVIGGVGVVIGLCIGLLMCWVLMTFPIPLPGQVYVQKNLPVRILPFVYACIASVSIALAAISAFYPALLASRLAPVKGLRID